MNMPVQKTDFLLVDDWQLW